MPALPPKPEKRPCDGCTACCEFLWVVEMDSPTGQPCIHQCNGCAIFGKPERPAVCSGFYCLYAKGDPIVTEPPDLCGVMVWIDEGEIRMRELRLGGFEQPWIRRALQAWAGKPVVMERLGTR